MGEVDRLIHEILQVRSQCQAEVGSLRRPWPVSTTSRVKMFSDLGLTFKEIAERTAIPYGSIMNWRDGRQSRKFHALTVAKTPTVTVANPPSVPDSMTTTVVTTSDGFRVELGTVVLAVELIVRLR